MVQFSLSFNLRLQVVLFTYNHCHHDNVVFYFLFPLLILLPSLRSARFLRSSILFCFIRQVTPAFALNFYSPVLIYQSIAITFFFVTVRTSFCSRHLLGIVQYILVVWDCFLTCLWRNFHYPFTGFIKFSIIFFGHLYFVCLYAFSP